MPEIEELPIPEIVASAERRMELARIWIADGSQVVSLSPRLWDDPGAWGLMLVDMARHVACAYQDQGFNQDDALDLTRSAMDAEWNNPIR